VSEALENQVRAVTRTQSGITEKRMFGGVAFLLHGKMFCGTAKGSLMLRLGPEAAEAALRQPHVRPMDFTGRPMRGYVFVDWEGCRKPSQIRSWIEKAITFVSQLPKSKPRAHTQARRTTKPL
jgi:TfoX/Sxy family transcriptional regulator of competence genes